MIIVNIPTYEEAHTTMEKLREEKRQREQIDLKNGVEEILKIIQKQIEIKIQGRYPDERIYFKDCPTFEKYETYSLGAEILKEVNTIMTKLGYKNFRIHEYSRSYKNKIDSYGYIYIEI